MCISLPHKLLLEVRTSPLFANARLTQAMQADRMPKVHIAFTQAIYASVPLCLRP